MRRTIFVLTIVAAAVALLGGCSGTGAPVADVRGASVQTLASDSLSAFTLMSSWAAIMWTRTSGGTSTYNETLYPSGNLKRIWGELSDGGSYVYNYPEDSPDSPVSGTISLTSGETLEEWANAQTSANNVFTQSGGTRYPNGAQLTWTTVQDWNVSPAPLTTTGEAITADNSRMTYRWYRIQYDGVHDGVDKLDLSLPDASTLHVETPLTSVFGAAYWPIFTQGATGSFRSAGGHTLNFKLTGQADRWDQWVFTAPGDAAGSFSLDAAMAGNGKLTTAGVVQAALHWTDPAGGTLNLLGTGQQEVSASAAAKDFQITKWISNAALLGPTPIF